MKSKILIIAVIMLFGTGMSYSQSKTHKHKGDCNHAEKQEFMGDKHHGPKIPDLTEAQEKQMKTLRLEFMKNIMPVKNIIGEKKAKLHSLKSAEKADITAINKQIDEIGILKTQIEKEQAKLEQDIRKLLTEEQRLFFDMHKEKRENHDNNHHDKGGKINKRKHKG